MSQPSHWETTLGQLGAFLAAQDAHHVEILDRGSFLDVSWQPAGGTPQERYFVEADFAQPRSTAWLSPASSIPAALLGTLGHEIDRVQFDVARIAEEADAFVVSGSSDGQYLSWWYPYAELRGGNAQPGANRAEPGPSISPWMGSPPVPKSSNATPMPVASAERDKFPLRHRLQLMP